MRASPPVLRLSLTRRTLLAVGFALATLTVLACSSSTQDAGAADAGADTGALEPSADAGGCCTPDPSPGCCMAYGGWSASKSCARTCDGMPVPSDPDWKLETDSHGCAQWTNPNDHLNGGKSNSATSYCGAVGKADAGPDAADGSTD